MATQKLEECQQNAEEVKVLMQDNAIKLLEREGKLENLEVRANELKKQAKIFEKRANTLKCKTCCEKWCSYFCCCSLLCC